MIRKATEEDLSRIAEIFVFNNRINYFPIFKQEEYSFGELQVVSMIDHYFGKGEVLENLYVADECGIVKGFMENGEKELEEGTTEYIAKLIRVEENVQLDEKPMHRKIMREEV